MTKKDESIVLFNQKQVRRHWDQDAEVWYFSIVDIIEVLTDSNRPRKYWSDLKKKLEAEGSEVSEKIGQLKMTAPDGKQRQTDVLDTENVLRLIQSIPSPKAEPFKLWLARVGYERIEETEDPELAFDRAMQTYLRKGYSKEWINQRLKSIEVRKELTEPARKTGIDDSFGWHLAFILEFEQGEWRLCNACPEFYPHKTADRPRRWRLDNPALAARPGKKSARPYFERRQTASNPSHGTGILRSAEALEAPARMRQARHRAGRKRRTGMVERTNRERAKGYDEVKSKEKQTQCRHVDASMPKTINQLHEM
jgi:hypothetical protein